MSFIQVILEAEATGEVKAVYEKTLAGLFPSVRATRGNKLFPVVRLFGLSPPFPMPGWVLIKTFTGPALPVWGDAIRTAAAFAVAPH